MRRFSWLLATLFVGACAQDAESPWLRGDPVTSDQPIVVPDADTPDTDIPDVPDPDTGGGAEDSGQDAPMDTPPDVPADVPPDAPPPDVPPPVGGRGLTFESGDYVELSGPGLNFGTAPFAVEVWYVPTDSSGPAALVGNRSIADAPGLILYDNSGPAFAMGTLGASIASSPLSTQVHVAVTRSNTSPVEVGFNGGTSIVRNGAGAGIIYQSSVDSPQPWRLGGTATGDLSFQGVLLRVRIWSRTLSSGELSQTADVNAATDSGLVAEFDFREGAGQTITSRVGSVTGQLGSTSGEDANDPAWAP